ncbi:MAG: DUF4920 domain-containing protein [Acidobacteriota bacterium]|jgi:hypothetical protein
MRRPSMLALLFVLVATPAAAEESFHGKDLELQTATPIAQILAHPHDYEGKLVQVRGEVTEVCQSMGCWLRIGDADGSLLLARSTGDKVRIPTDSKGRSVVVEGTVVIEHEDPPSHDEEAKGHTCATATVRLETRGVHVL